MAQFRQRTLLQALRAKDCDGGPECPRSLGRRIANGGPECSRSLFRPSAVAVRAVRGYALVDLKAEDFIGVARGEAVLAFFQRFGGFDAVELAAQREHG